MCIEPKGLEGILQDDPSLADKITYDEYKNGAVTSKEEGESLTEAYGCYSHFMKRFTSKK